MTKASHYISVIKKDSSFYACNGITGKIENINNYMFHSIIVACFYVDPKFKKVVNASSDFNENSLFTLNNFKFFKIYSNNPFLYNHPEFNSSKYIIDYEEPKSLEESSDEEIYIPSDDDLEETIDLDVDPSDFIEDPIEENETKMIENDEITLSDFLSMNRFLYDSLIRLDKPSIQNVANDLEMNKRTLKNNLISHKITRNMKDLKNLALNIELQEPPHVYTLLSNLIVSTDSFIIDSRYIELIIPCTYCHFDYYNLLFNRSSFPSKLKNGIPKNFDFSNIALNTDKYFNIEKKIQNSNALNDYDEFKQKMISIYEKIPEIFKKIDGDERFLINSHISIAFLYGNVEIAKGGIGSPRLKGTFSINARKQGTGYLNLDSILKSKKVPDLEKMTVIMSWLKENNPLYREIAPVNIEFYQTIIEPAFATRTDVIGIAKLPNSCEQLDPQ